MSPINFNIIRMKKVLYILIFYAICISILIFGAYLFSTNKLFIQLMRKKSEHESKIKYILYWNKFWNMTNMSFGLGSEIFSNCAVNTCLTTYNRSMMPVDYFDAIIFYAPTLGAPPWRKRRPIYLPTKRNSFQKYIYYTRESPITYPVDIAYNYNFFNWTMTYRRDSDIFFPYAIVTKQKNNYSKPSTKDFKMKKKMVAWFVSNCKSNGTKTRKKYVTELKKYIQVDVYGKCGDRLCSKKSKLHCYKMLEKKYKFYLSFENSMCLDYITEKLFHVLHYNIIPIVLGAGDYNSMAPPDSFINTNSFDGPKALAMYLYQLSNNSEEYMKYFEWKNHFIIKKSNEFALCQLCEKLQHPLYTVYENLQQWALGKFTEICTETNYHF